LGQIADAGREAVSAGVRGEAALHPWVAFGIMPLFALANAGVNLGGIDFGEPGAPMVFTGIALGLLIGKPVGVLLATWITLKLRLSVLPPGVTWGGILVVGVAGAIGFTMAIFISELAFSDPDLLAVAKLGVLAATALAGAGALLLGRVLLPKEQPAEVAGISESTMEMAAVWTGETKRTAKD
jgi:NhaA family Na+:H+ antiporter